MLTNTLDYLDWSLPILFRTGLLYLGRHDNAVLRPLLPVLYITGFLPRMGPLLRRRRGHDCNILHYHVLSSDQA